MKKSACKKCKLIVDGDVCPSCKSNQFTTNWKGRLFIVDATKSAVAKKMGVQYNGEYAIKVN